MHEPLQASKQLASTGLYMRTTHELLNWLHKHTSASTGSTTTLATIQEHVACKGPVLCLLCYHVQRHITRCQNSRSSCHRCSHRHCCRATTKRNSRPIATRKQEVHCQEEVQDLLEEEAPWSPPCIPCRHEHRQSKACKQPAQASRTQACNKLSQASRTQVCRASVLAFLAGCSLAAKPSSYSCISDCIHTHTPLQTLSQ